LSEPDELPHGVGTATRPPVFSATQIAHAELAAKKIPPELQIWSVVLLHGPVSQLFVMLAK
jgi:hypothetical protein